MADRGDIDRRTVLKGLGTAAVTTGVGVRATSQTGAAVGPSFKPDWYATHDNVVPIEVCTERERNPLSPYRGRCIEWEQIGFETVPSSTYDGYAVKKQGGDGDWNRSGPSSGDTVVVWAHGWQKGGLYGDTATEAVPAGMTQTDRAWRAIHRAVEDSFLDSVDHTVGWAWNSASAAANFRSAVSQAHRIGPEYYSTFLQDLAERIYSGGGTVHLAAHSLGAWMTLEALAEVYQREGDDGPVAKVLDSVRFISGAVPSSAVGGQGGGNRGWTNLEGYWSGGVGPGSDTGCRAYDWDHTYSPPRRYCTQRNDPSRTYDKNGLLLPDRVVNGYYDCDEVLSTTCCWSVNPTCGPFRLYMKNFHEGSSSEAIGTRPLTDSMDAPAADIWENVDMTANCPRVASHTGSYKHPDYGSDAGGGQFSVWRPDSRGDCIGN